MMGVTLHYGGVLKSPALISEITSEVQDIAEAKNWKYKLIGEHPTDEYLQVKGIMMLPPECEPISITFLDTGKLISPIVTVFSDEEVDKIIADPNYRAFTKTQFSGVDLHIEIVHLLSYLGDKYFDEWHLLDEGGYYPDQNRPKLEETMGHVTKTMDALSEAFEAHADQIDPSDPEKMAEFIKGVLGVEDIEVKVINASIEESEDGTLDIDIIDNQQIEDSIQDLLSGIGEEE